VSPPKPSKNRSELGTARPSCIEVRPQDFEAQVAAAMEVGAPVLSFTFGIPKTY
jgi:hypothetical protein